MFCTSPLVAVELLVGGNYSAARLCYALWTETESTAVRLYYMALHTAMRGECTYESLLVRPIWQEISVSMHEEYGPYLVESLLEFSFLFQTWIRSHNTIVIRVKPVSNLSLHVLTLVNGCSSTLQRCIPGGKPRL